jgi:hypothetical protein
MYKKSLKTSTIVFSSVLFCLIAYQTNAYSMNDEIRVLQERLRIASAAADRQVPCHKPMGHMNGVTILCGQTRELCESCDYAKRAMRQAEDLQDRLDAIFRPRY